jgi:hypothetical protein
LLASAGIGFAVFLMFMQIGFRNALFDNTVQLARLLKADFFLVSPARYNLPSEQRFDRLWLDRARAVEGVQRIVPVYIERSITQLRVVGNKSRSIRAVGIPLESGVVEPLQWQPLLAMLSDGRTALLCNRFVSRRWSCRGSSCGSPTKYRSVLTLSMMGRCCFPIARWRITFRRAILVGIRCN